MTIKYLSIPCIHGMYSIRNNASHSHLEVDYAIVAGRKSSYIISRPVTLV